MKGRECCGETKHCCRGGGMFSRMHKLGKYDQNLEDK